MWGWAANWYYYICSCAQDKLFFLDMHPKQCTQTEFKKVCFTNMNENQLTVWYPSQWDPWDCFAATRTSYRGLMVEWDTQGIPHIQSVSKSGLSGSHGRKTCLTQIWSQEWEQGLQCKGADLNVFYWCFDPEGCQWCWIKDSFQASIISEL